MKKREIEVTVKAKFGSEWQAEIQPESLQLMLTAWVTHIKSRHKKNDATFEVK
jgi:hypothetical protein